MLPLTVKAKQFVAKDVAGTLLVIFSVFVMPVQAGSDDAFDPYEGVNRKVFAFNEFVDRWLLKPVAKGYRWVTPNFVDDGVSNFFDNLGEVRNLVNGGLQGDFNHAGTATGRLLVNSTVGLGGLFDVATGWGLEERKEDFGQTLAVWGVGDGPYIVLPLLGGGNLRDSFGRMPDIYLAPETYLDDVPTRNSLRALDLIDIRADLIDAEAFVSGDRYTFLRDITRQQRESSIANGAVQDDFGDEHFDDDF